MSGLLVDARQAFQSLRRQPRFLATATVTLAIGIGGTTAIFSVLNSVLLEPLPYHDPGRLVRLERQVRADSMSYFSRPDFLDLREQARSFAGVASYYDYTLQGFDLTGHGSPRRVAAMPVSADYFATLGTELFLGRSFTRQDERPESRQVIVSFRFWKECLGENPGTVGRTILLDREPWTVVAVLPAGFQEPFGREIDVWRADDLTPGQSSRSNNYLSLVGRLRPGVTVAEAQAEIDTIVGAIDVASPGREPWRVRLQPLHEAVVGSSRIVLLVLFGTAMLVLLIACVNVANLTLARNINRERELAMRLALGAGRRRLVRQLLAESLLVSVPGGLGGTGIAWVALAGLHALRPEGLPRLEAVTLDGKVLLFAAVMSTITGILFGLAPALRTSRSGVGGTLRDSGRGATGGVHHRRLRSALVASEISVAFVLLVGAALLVQSLIRLLAVDPGFSARTTVAFQLSLPVSSYPVDDPARRIELDRQLRERLAALPGVAAAGAVSKLPLTGAYHVWGYAIRGQADATGELTWHSANVRVVSGDYFPALRVSLLRGRFFSEADTLDATGVALVNRALVERHFDGREPLGEWIGNGRDWWQIVGVVENERTGVRDQIPDRVYYPYSQWVNNRAWAMTWVVRGKEGFTPASPAVRAAVAALDPDLVPTSVASLDALAAMTVSRERFAMILLAAFAAAALVLAAVGVHGVLSYTVAQRMPEMGLRLALGARAAQIRGSILREAVGMTVVALLLGAAGAWALTRLLGSLAFEVSLTDRPTFVGVSALLLLMAGAVSLIPAERAVRADPSSLLRSG